MATAAQNGEAVAVALSDDMEAALDHEEGIAIEAKEIRGETIELTPALFMELWPLLKRPIPLAFIQTVPPTRGKPYESTGIKSVQVQIDRMNNVLTPLWWRDEVEYEDGGKLATVTISVGGDRILAARTSRGGVAQGSGAGNIYKGSYTNAAKLAFARLGVGHEVYVGATDLDPDVDRDLAEAAKGEEPPKGIGSEIAQKMVDRAWEIPAAKSHLQLAASHAAERDIGDCSTQAKAQKALADLTFAQAEKVDRWIASKDKPAEEPSGGE